MQHLKNTLKSNLPFLFNSLSWAKASIIKQLVNFQRKALIENITSFHKNNQDTKDVLSFLTEHGIHMVPYFYINEYKNKEIVVLQDDDSKLRYVNFGERRIYFPDHMIDSYIREAVVNAYIEQDKRSPHKYLPIDEILIGGDVAILCGASDGIYTLEIAHLFNKIYLFEADPRWVRPLKHTLRDILHKVEIVPLYISNRDSEGCITIDSFMREREGEVNYLQADIEDAELRMLIGATNLLTKATNLKMSICCYHTSHQEAELTSYLQKFGFTVSTSMGYLLLWMQYPLKHPYLRRGVLYAQKLNNK